MADYKLRLDVDAKLLEQALEKAVKKAFGKIPAMSGGGIGGGFGGSTTEAQKIKFKEKKWKQSKKLTIEEHKLRNKNLYDMKSAYIREKAALRAHNIMLEKSGAQAQRTFRMLGQLVGGRMGGSAGQVVDMGLQGLSRARSGRRQTRATKLAYEKMDDRDKRVYDTEHGGPPETSGGFNKVMDKFDQVKSGPIGQFMKKNKEAFNKKNPKTGKALGVAGKTAGVMGKGGTQLVKLAGIGASLAGGAGLGKMIVDSSPMLKAMLKLLNVGVMLILRPIGDFIGFMLRPLLLHFVKNVAIPAYKQGSQLAKEWGDKAGKVMLDLFTQPVMFLEKAIINPIKQALEMGWNGMMIALAKLGVYIVNILDPAEQQAEYERLDKELAELNKSTKERYPGYGEMDQISKMMAEYQGPPEPPVSEDLPPWSGTLTGIVPQLEQEQVDIMTQINENAEIIAENTKKIEEVIPFVPVNSDGKTQDEVMAEQIEESINNPYKRPTPKGSVAIENEAAAKEALRKTLGGAGIAIISAAGQRILAKWENYKKGAPGSGTSPIAGGRNARAYEALTGVDLGPRAVDSREDAELWSEAFEAAAELGTDVDDEYKKLKESAINSKSNVRDSEAETRNILTFTKDAAGNMEAVGAYTQAMMSGIAGSWVFIKQKLARMGFSISGGGNIDIGSGSGSGSGSGEKTDSQKLIESEAKWRLRFGDGGPDVIKTLNTDGVAYYRKMYRDGTPYKDRGRMLSFTKMAKGGIISEKIFGIGASTGQGYMFGEAGPETVTPGVGGTVNNGGGSTFNITINASNVGDIERQLKPAILRMLKESTARAGIV